MKLFWVFCGLAVSMEGGIAKPVALSEKAKALHASAVLVDGHNDLPWALRQLDDSQITKTNLREKVANLHTDIPRLRAGGMGAQFWSVYVPAETMFSGDSLKQTLQQIDIARRLVRKHPDIFEMAATAADVRRIQNSRKIASLIGVEGGHSIENSLDALRLFYMLGVRYMTITHSKTLGWADSATDESKSNGLNEFGRNVIAEMNRLGMLADISHVSPKTMKDVLAVTKAPVIASHSSAYAIAKHPRNVPDDVLRLVAKNGGVIMVNFFSAFILPNADKLRSKSKAAETRLRQQYPDDSEFKKAMDQWYNDNPLPTGDVGTVVDHIEHIIKVAGIDHVGLGGDYDGVPVLPKQLEDVSGYPYITQELLNRNYSEADIKKILGENSLRVLARAEVVAAEMQREDGQ